MPHPALTLVPLALSGMLILAACVAEEPAETGASLYAAQCASCHGAGGKGDGPLAEGLPSGLPDLTTLSQRHGGTFPRDFVMSTIDGYSRTEQHGAQIMPEFGERDLGEMVMLPAEGDGQGIPVPSRLLILADYVEGLQKP